MTEENYSTEILTDEETREFTELDSLVNKNVYIFYETGLALLAIRDKRLYRAAYKTFEHYCQERLGIARRTAYQLIEAASVFENVRNCAQMPVNEAQTRPLVSLEPEEQREVWNRAIRTAPNGGITAAHVQRTVEEFKPKASHQLINSSANNEWYTPAVYIEAVTELLGVIDLDPASNEFANRTVKAKDFFTINDNGLTGDWWGRVFLNPPYGFSEDGESNQSLWSRKLIQQYKDEYVKEAVLLVNAVPSNKWFAPLWAFPICFTDHRIRFYNEEAETGQPTHSNVFVYMGKQVKKFVEIFERFGVIAMKVGFDERGDLSIQRKV